MISIERITQKNYFANCATLKIDGRYRYESFFEINQGNINHAGCVYVDRQYLSLGDLPTTDKPKVIVHEVVVDFMYQPQDKNLIEVVLLVEEKEKHFLFGHYCCPDCGGDAAICDCPEED